MDWSVVTTWAFAVVAALGVGGTIIACILAPAIALPILESVVSAILRCKICMWILLALALCAGSFWFGHHTAVLACREAEFAAELRNRNIDLENASKARSDETERANDIKAKANEQHAKDADYIEQLKNVPACLLNDTDINGMHKPVWSGRAKSPAGSK